MKNYIPTIEELLGKPANELRAIFRKASAVADDGTRPAQEREAASRSVENGPLDRYIQHFDCQPPTLNIANDRTTTQNVSAKRAVQMSEALKQGPCTVAELVTLTTVETAAVERWLSLMQTFNRVSVGGAAQPRPRYRWLPATEIQQ